MIWLRRCPLARRGLLGLGDTLPPSVYRGPMGLFTKKDPAEKLEKLQVKSREKATKAGVDVAGALAVGHDLNDDAAHCTFVVWPDRVELHNHGKIGSVTRSGAGVTTLPLAQVSSVSANNAGIYGLVQVVAGVQVLEFRTNQIEAPALADAVRQASG